MMSFNSRMLTKFLISSCLVNSQRWFASGSSFKFNDLQIQLCRNDQLKKKPETKTIVFGSHFTDHMFEVEWSLEKGWGKPLISPFHDLVLHPGAKVFHYAVQMFEGMKAFRTKENRILLFRPDMNVRRMLTTTERLSLPSFDGTEFLKCMRKLVSIEKDWVPSEEASSLYIRPTVIGTDNLLGVGKSNKALLYIILCPVGSYFETWDPVGLLADSKFVRAWPGGCGEHKMGANYAPTIAVQQLAEQQGFQQILWLYGKEHYITESGATNVFVFLINEQGERELVTPPLDGLILPGVIRQSLLDLTREKKEFKVTERPITMSEVIKALEQKRLLEFFASGTACVVCPVSAISYNKVKYSIPTMDQKEPMCMKLMNELLDIQYGRTKHPWSVNVE